MTDTTIFLTDVCLAGVATCLVVIYLRAPLRAILIDLCGSRERANFWVAFSNVAPVVVPLIFALDYWPEARPGHPAISEIGVQLKHALIGLILTLVTLGVLLVRTITTNRPAAAEQGRQPL